MSLLDSVSSVGPDFVELGYTKMGEAGEPHHSAAIGSDTRRRYGFQFHPEVDDTVHGSEMLGNFVLGICGCEPSWTMQRYLEEQVARAREQVGDRSVFLLASGGVDSTVAAKLFGLALGPDRLHLLHIDNGLMRKDESRKVLQMLRDLRLDRHLHFVDASETFLKALEGVVDPEQKRRIIGDTFIEVFEREAERLGIDDQGTPLPHPALLLGQGTIYPDTIETGGTKRADTIKTHHNRVPIVERMIAEGRVVEPLAELYKVEVRELGERLRVPREIIWRHPFPGPGLGIRLLCSDGREDREGFEEIEPKVAEIAKGYGMAAMVLPIRSVGVKADLRSYEHPVLVTERPSRSTPLQADRPWTGKLGPYGESDVEWERLLEAAGTMFRQVIGINRCLWNLGSSAPARVRPLPATVTRSRLDLLREADAIVMDGLRRHGVYDTIWQCPTVLVPLEIDGAGRELVIVRPIHSERAMTAAPARLPTALLADLCRQILRLPDVSGLALDVTSKPPGTIEWE